MTTGQELAHAQLFGAQDDDEALWAAFEADGGQPARERLFDRYMPFARLIAARHFRKRRGGDIEFPELCQLAYAGLLEAIDHFDRSRGVPFKGYAHRRISGSVLDGIAKVSELREQLSYRGRVRAERVQSLATAEPENLSTGEAMQALIDLAVGLAVGFMLEDTGLYVSEGEVDSRTSAYESLAWREAVQRLAGEVSDLPDREKLIIRRHYFHGMTFDQIGALLGLTKGRISQLHRAALALLKKRLRRAGDFRLER